MTASPARRLLVLLAALILALVGVVTRLGMLQVRRSSAYAELGYEQRVRTVALPADRGEILDRTGAPLAISLDARDVYANPSFVEDPAAEAATLAPLLRMKVGELRRLLASNGTFVWVARQVGRDRAEHIAALRLPGIDFLPSTRRYYPADALAAQVLGFVGVDGTGLSGLEAQYESVLAGTPGERTSEVSPIGQQIAGGLETTTDPVPGSDLILTLDREMQFQAQEYLRRAVRENDARGGTIIVMDPRTGDVYAMASTPSFDPNHFADFPRSVYRNRAVTDTWEPGSVNKIITAAAALENGSVRLDQVFQVPSTRHLTGATIHDAHQHGVEAMTLADIIAQSSNVGISLVADEVGSPQLASYFARFGFGQSTGIGFPGEASGLIPPLDAWTPIDRATMSFGSGVAVSPLQMASVYATIANGGEWVQPRLVRATRDAAGVVRETDSSPTHEVIEPSTAGTLARMLTYVVEDGTGENARIPGYQVAGKTGTSKKLEHRGYVDRYVASFIGFLPAGDPQVVIAAVIDEPATVYGGVAAAPLFQNVARYAIQRLGIEPAPPVPLPRHALFLP
jgi:cell division protein FtsI (penicillin-binding protein 3)